MIGRLLCTRLFMNPFLSKPPACGFCVLDQPYVSADQRECGPSSAQVLDLFVPCGAGPFPLVIWIHGGGWHSGSKQPDGVKLAARFLSHGFALAAIDYRLTPEVPFPAQLEDCNRALAWLREHASEHRIDPGRIGVMGHSAGAHLCAMMATTGGVHPVSKTSVAGGRVQAAVCWAPPCDLDRERGDWPRTMFTWNPADMFSRTFFPHGCYNAEFAREASPASYVHGGVPPILIVHGERDMIVPIGQAARFSASLREAGVKVSFRVDAEAGHHVMRKETELEALDFFKHTLRRADQERGV